MFIIKKWLDCKSTSLFLGVIFGGMIFSFKNPKENLVKLIFHQKPLKLLAAIESFKSDKNKLFHGFEHRESDLPGDLHVGGQLCFNFHSREHIDLKMAWYFESGENSYHEFTITIRISDLDLIVNAINDFFVEK
ncbi:hypothetical protein A2572_01190 [Candidatus Collierbacteria bacterium RIFOXYD1_FULL_40_9]|uniref:Uncharacterized protein n=1 Tax=Candidatus Collierbacteria bacterium RIFOXYD1_FULL_40_9 TaxID=1817731 RepID=A0A1F5FP40_9BACT|nr:MAG: hypothetical protein A2572_01190 [Candidatus Collierbacteria bacterium RIFOXYD1_FULL_40_9]